MADAALFTILSTIRTEVVGLQLAGLADANVVVQKAPSNLEKDLPEGKYPCVVIAPFGAEGVTAGSNLRDDVAYPVLIAIVADERSEIALPQSEQLERFELYLKWRERIRKNFSNQRLTSTLVFNIVVQPLDITDRERWFRQGLWVSGLVLRLSNREDRSP
jgi:hypothetical protein